MFDQKIAQLQNHLVAQHIDLALITDEDSIYYLTGYYDYLHMEFGRPTILVVPSQGQSRLITPTIDLVMAEATARVDEIIPWNDGDGEEWRSALPELIRGTNRLGLESNQMPPLVRSYINTLIASKNQTDVAPILGHMRMVKSEEELQLARHAGMVANAMMTAGRDAISDGVAEYEVALATSAAGARKAAELLSLHYQDSSMSPNTHFLQIMASGEEITKTHHRATTRVMSHGEPVFLCFCGMTNFHRFKLGFDRTFWIGEVTNPHHQDVYAIAIESQRAALDAIGPGVTAQSVHEAYAKIIQDAGFDYPFRCGRATGFSFLEQPQLVTGDKTVLKPGMVFAVDGSVSTAGFRAQVGDSLIITEDGYDLITDHPKTLESVVI